MLIDSKELIKYIEQPCENCNSKDTSWCEHCCEVGNFVDEIESFLDLKRNSEK